MNEIAIVNPKYVQNLASIVRAAACLGANKVWYSGSRIKFEDRIPREMRLYKEIELINDDYFISKSGLTPVAVELLPGAQDIRNFRHPENPTLYVFGPEDGSIPKSIRRLCHSFIQIPTKHCVSLPAAVHLTLYDRMIKQ